MIVDRSLGRLKATCSCCSFSRPCSPLDRLSGSSRPLFHYGLAPSTACRPCKPLLRPLLDRGLKKASSSQSTTQQSVVCKSGNNAAVVVALGAPPTIGGCALGLCRQYNHAGGNRIEGVLASPTDGRPWLRMQRSSAQILQEPRLSMWKFSVPVLIRGECASLAGADACSRTAI